MVIKATFRFKILGLDTGFPESGKYLPPNIKVSLNFNSQKKNSIVPLFLIEKGFGTKSCPPKLRNGEPVFQQLRFFPAENNKMSI